MSEFTARALELVKEHRANVVEYNEMKKECKKDGYRPSHCFHGVYLWRDYDVICGACESSEFYLNEWSTSLEVMRYAISTARQEARQDKSSARGLILVALDVARDMKNRGTYNDSVRKVLSNYIQNEHARY